MWNADPSLTFSTFSQPFGSLLTSYPWLFPDWHCREASSSTEVPQEPEQRNAYCECSNVQVNTYNFLFLYQVPVFDSIYCKDFVMISEFRLRTPISTYVSYQCHSIIQAFTNLHNTTPVPQATCCIPKGH